MEVAKNVIVRDEGYFYVNSYKQPENFGKTIYCLKHSSDIEV